MPFEPFHCDSPYFAYVHILYETRLLLLLLFLLLLLLHLLNVLLLCLPLPTAGVMDQGTSWRALGIPRASWDSNLWELPAAS
eukprot:8503781-Pyramimonas_sp.AAC.1